MPSPLAIGDLVAERYEVRSIVGEGITGTVYCALDTQSHDLDNPHEVALKVIHPHLSSDRQVRGRFRREADILRHLEGEYLCRMTDSMEREDGLIIMVLEYVRGGSLQQYMDEHAPLTVVEALEVTRQICLALSAAHAQGIVHRDLKPANVLLERRRDESPALFREGLSLRVVDFGLAKLLHGDTQGTALTEIDMIFGTPAYMAPEQVQGEDLDARADVYAAGVILFELLVGRVPFDSPTAIGMMMGHVNEPLIAPSAAAPGRGISKRIDRIVMAAMAKDLDARLESANDLREAIEACVARMGAEEQDGETVKEESSLSEGPSTLDSGNLLHVEPRRSSNAAEPPNSGGDRGQIGRTMQSKYAVVQPEERPRISIKVSEAPMSSTHRLSSTIRRSLLGGDSGSERRLWTVGTVLIVVIAMVVGVWLGSK